MTLVERAAELDFLRWAVREGTKRKSVIGVVHGPVASGKTSLLGACTEMALRSGATTLRAAGSRQESTQPFGTVRQLLQDSPPPSIAAGDTVRRLNDDTLTAMLSEPAEPLVARVHDGFHALLRELAEHQPVVLAIDDAHHMDEHSLRCVLYVARRLRSSPVTIVLTVCALAPEEHPLLMHELLRQPNCRNLRLAPLSERGVQELVAGQLATRDVDPAWHEISGGSPLLVRALVDDYRMSAAKGHGPVPGDAFGQAVLSCVRRGTPATLVVARGIAVLGELSAPASLGRLLNLPSGQLAQITRTLTAAGLLQHGRLRHPRARVAILDDLAMSDGSDLHRRAARLLHEDGATASTIAGLLLATDPIREPWAVRVLHDAAGRALGDDEVEFANDCLRLATWACTDERERVRTRAMLIDVAWRLNPLFAERHLTTQVAVLRETEVGVRHLLPLIEQLLWHGRVAEATDAMTALGRALDGAAEDTDDSTGEDAAGDVLATRRRLAATHPTLLRQFPEPAIPSRSASATGADACRRQATTALAEVFAGRTGEEAVGSAEEVLRNCRLGATTLDAIEAALLTLMYSDHLTEAAHWCVRLLERLPARHAPTWTALLTGIRAEIAYRQGDLRTSEECAGSALAQLTPQGWGVAIGGPLATLLAARVAMGRYDAAATVLDQPVSGAMFRTRYGLCYRHARGHYYLATGRVNLALDEFLSCGDMSSDWHLDIPALVPWRTSAAQAYLCLGKQDEARELIEEQLARTGPERPRTLAMSLRVLAATRELPERLDVLGRAVELLKSCGDRLELARALTDLTSVHSGLNRPRRARMLAQLARHVARSCHAKPLLGNDRPAVATVPARNTDAKLTNAEGRVALLAARGYTNREIATRQFITASTVEQHLTRVYRKLNVRQREELPIALGLQITDDFPAT